MPLHNLVLSETRFASDEYGATFQEPNSQKGRLTLVLLWQKIANWTKRDGNSALVRESSI